jgi:hypothetical protein
MARDLSELSKLWTGTKVIWLGPRLSPGFQASPLYYYIFFPALVAGGGNAVSLIVFNVVLGLSALLVLGYFLVKKWGSWGVVPSLFFWLSPLWQGIILHFGNGFSYVYFLLLSLTCLYFDLPILLSSILLGISISFHPGAVFAVPILFYEWYRKKHSALHFLYVLFGLIAPWAPIILFEVITKGYLFRQWRQNPATGIHAKMNAANIKTISSFFYLNTWIACAAGIGSIIMSTKKLKIYWILCFFSLIFFAFISAVPSHYMFGILCMLLFCTSVFLVQSKFGRVVMLCFIVIFFIFNVITKPLKPASRTITKIDTVTKTFIKKARLDKNKKIAVVAVTSNDTKVPQADDYRFFLRTHGYTVMEVQNYNQADSLVMFVEVPKFHWESWSSWEVSQFGNKKVTDVLDINGVKVVLFSKL